MSSTGSSPETDNPVLRVGMKSEHLQILLAYQSSHPVTNGGWDMFMRDLELLHLLDIIGMRLTGEVFGERLFLKMKRNWVRIEEGAGEGEHIWQTHFEAAFLVIVVVNEGVVCVNDRMNPPVAWNHVRRELVSKLCESLDLKIPDWLGEDASVGGASV